MRDPTTQRPPEGREVATNTLNQPPKEYPSPEHGVFMRLLSTRLRWLEAGHRHWWIRSIEEHRAGCSWCRRCDGGVAA